MGYPIQVGQTAQPLLFLLVSSTDHITGLTGATPIVTLSKVGGSFASPAGAVSEVGDGWYKVAGNATDANTPGPLALHATASGADPYDDDGFVVVGYDPLSTTLGSSIGLSSGTVSASPSPTSTTFTATGSSLNTTNGGYTTAPMSILWQTGANAGFRYPISGHVVSGSNHAFTTPSAMANTPSNNDTFVIV